MVSTLASSLGGRVLTDGTLRVAPLMAEHAGEGRGGTPTSLFSCQNREAFLATTFVTVYAPDGRAFGPYPVASGPLDTATSIKEYEGQALSRALEDGLSGVEATSCTFDVVYPKDSAND